MAVSSIGTNLQTPECSIQLTGKASIPEYMYIYIHTFDQNPIMGFGQMYVYIYMYHDNLS